MATIAGENGYYNFNISPTNIQYNRVTMEMSVTDGTMSVGDLETITLGITTDFVISIGDGPTGYYRRLVDLSTFETVSSSQIKGSAVIYPDSSSSTHGQNYHPYLLCGCSSFYCYGRADTATDSDDFAITINILNHNLIKYWTPPAPVTVELDTYDNSNATFIITGGAKDDVQNASDAIVETQYCYSLDGGTTFTAWTTLASQHDPSVAQTVTISIIGAGDAVIFKARQQAMQGSNLIPDTYSEEAIKTLILAYISSPILTQAESAINYVRGNTYLKLNWTQTIPTSQNQLTSYLRYSTDGGNTYTNWEVLGIDTPSGTYSVVNLPFGSNLRFQTYAARGQASSTPVEFDFSTPDKEGVTDISWGYDELRRKAITWVITSEWGFAKDIYLDLTVNNTTRTLTVATNSTDTAFTVRELLVGNYKPNQTVSYTVRVLKNNTLFDMMSGEMTTARPILGIAISPNGTKSYITDVVSSRNTNSVPIINDADKRYDRFLVV